jgi:SM-20-related protein
MAAGDARKRPPAPVRSRWRRYATRHDEPPRTFSDADAEGLAHDGFVVLDGFLGDDDARAVRVELEALLDRGAFREARIGHGPSRQRAEGIRSERICWFNVDRTDVVVADHDRDAGDDDDGVMPGPAVRRYLAALDVVRMAIARSCFPSLGHIELHAVCYEPGARYGAHLDTFRDDTRRVISVCDYLNEAWHDDDGGFLRLHTQPTRDLAPRFDRLVIFRSGTMLHEVLTVRRRRLSMTGWMGAARRA